MGQYDIIDGDIFEYFPFPYISFYDDTAVISSTSDIPTAAKPAYMTPYHNFTKDFVMWDERWDAYGHNRMNRIYVVRDGCVIESWVADKIPDNYEWPQVVVSPEYDRYNVKSLAEFKQMVQDSIEAHEMHTHMVAEAWDTYVNEHGPVKHITPAITAVIVDNCSKAYDMTYQVFNDKYLDNSHDSPFVSIGLVVGLWEYAQANNTGLYTPAQWSTIKTALMSLYEGQEDPIAGYLDWCKQEGIIISEQYVRDIFNVHIK